MNDLVVVEKTEQTNCLALVQQHERRLALPPRSLQQAIAWTDDARRLRHRIKIERASLQLSNRATAVWLSWCREIGKMLGAIPLQSGNRTPGSHRGTPRLRDLGLTKRRSSEYQRLARIPDGYFNDYLWSRIKEGREISMAEAQRVAAGFVARKHPTPRPRYNNRETAMIRLDAVYDIADAALEAVRPGPDEPGWHWMLLDALDVTIARVDEVIPVRDDWNRQLAKIRPATHRDRRNHTT